MNVLYLSQVGIEAVELLLGLSMNNFSLAYSRGTFIVSEPMNSNLVISRQATPRVSAVSFLKSATQNAFWCHESYIRGWLVSHTLDLFLSL